ncbi:hypothetical protein DUNSADRAFT_9744, partial [Dunaliella salina]
MDLVEMVMAKADARIAVLYDRMLVEERLWHLGEEIRNRLRSTQAAILSVADKSALLGPSLVPAAPNSKKLTAALPVSHAM